MLNGCTAAAVATGNPVAAVKPTRVAISPVASSVKPIPLSATVSLSGHDWDTRIAMNCTYGPGPPVMWAAEALGGDQLPRRGRHFHVDRRRSLEPGPVAQSLWRGAFHHRGVRRGRGECDDPNFSASVKCVNPSRKYRDQDPSPPQSWANCCDGRAAEENGNGESSTGRFGPAFMQHSEVCTSR